MLKTDGRKSPSWRKATACWEILPVRDVYFICKSDTRGLILRPPFPPDFSRKKALMLAGRIDARERKRGGGGRRQDGNVGCFQRRGLESLKSWILSFMKHKCPLGATRDVI